MAELSNSVKKLTEEEKEKEVKISSSDTSQEKAWIIARELLGISQFLEGLSKSFAKTSEQSQIDNRAFPIRKSFENEGAEPKSVEKQGAEPSSEYLVPGKLYKSSNNEAGRQQRQDIPLPTPPYSPSGFSAHYSEISGCLSPQDSNSTLSLANEDVPPLLLPRQGTISHAEAGLQAQTNELYASPQDSIEHLSEEERSKINEARIKDSKEKIKNLSKSKKENSSTDKDSPRDSYFARRDLGSIPTSEPAPTSSLAPGQTEGEKRQSSER